EIDDSGCFEAAIAGLCVPQQIDALLDLCAAFDELSCAIAQPSRPGQEKAVERGFAETCLDRDFRSAGKELGAFLQRTSNFAVFPQCLCTAPEEGKIAGVNRTAPRSADIVHVGGDFFQGGKLAPALDVICTLFQKAGEIVA